MTPSQPFRTCWIWVYGLLFSALSCAADTAFLATSTPSTQEYVILEARGGEAQAIAKAYPGRLRKRPTPPAAFRLNNVVIEAPSASSPDLRQRAPVGPGENPGVQFAEFPAHPAPVAAPTPNTAQDFEGSSLVAAVSPTAATGDLIRCGARTPTTLTVCLNGQQALNKLDHIAVLAFTQDPSVAYVDGDAERAVLAEVLAGLPNHLEIADLPSPRDPDTPAASAGRIHLVRKP